MQYHIGKDNKRPADFGKLLTSPSLKEKCVPFFIEDQINDEYFVLCDGKTIKVNYDKGHVCEAVNGRMKRSMITTCLASIMTRLIPK